MIEKWITAGWTEVPMVLVTGSVTYAAILLYTRIVGLRSLSKISAADFSMTVAVGSLFASTVSAAGPSMVVGLAAIAVLYCGQWLIAWLRRRSSWITNVIENRPLLLMSGSTMLDENLERANVTRDDIYGKLREANALNYDQVLAVVFEPTGDISVLHSSNADASLEPDFLKNVIGYEQLFQTT